jgi:O6-methylguanine-DNA--protein-cysteine methyltransferase
MIALGAFCQEAIMTATAELAERIFSHRMQEDNVPLALHVQWTNFQVKIWQALLCLPAGSATTCGELAVVIRKRGILGNTAGARRARR